jgi:hypothetical protein
VRSATSTESKSSTATDAERPCAARENFVSANDLLRRALLGTTTVSATIRTTEVFDKELNQPRGRFER